MSDRKPRRRNIWIAALCCVAMFSVAAPSSVWSAEPAPPAPMAKDHKHKWVTASKKKWIPPVIKKVAVGKDKNGKPIYKEKVVQKGRYQTVKVKRCKKCGKEKG